MAEVFAVLSGKGGTGKTTVCAGLATTLASQGRRVLAVDCDVGLRNLDICLGMTEVSALSFLDVCQGGYPIDQSAHHPLYPSLVFLTAPVSCTPEAVDPAAFQAMLNQARQDFDYIFLDAPAGVGAGFQLTAQAADRFLLVAGPEPAAVRDAGKTAQVLELMGKSQVRLIVNRVDKKLLRWVCITIDDVMDTAGIPLLGVVVQDHRVPLAACFGYPLCRYAPRSPAAKAIARIARRLEGYTVAIPMG